MRNDKRIHCWKEENGFGEIISYNRELLNRQIRAMFIFEIGEFLSKSLRTPLALVVLHLEEKL